MKPWRRNRSRYALCLTTESAREPVVRLRRAGHRVSVSMSGLRQVGGAFRFIRAAWSE